MIRKLAALTIQGLARHMPVLRELGALTVLAQPGYASDKEVSKSQLWLSQVHISDKEARSSQSWLSQEHDSDKEARSSLSWLSPCEQA